MPWTTMVVSYAAVVVISSAVNAMSPPTEPRGFYTWFYKFVKLVTVSAAPMIEKELHISLPAVPVTTQVEVQATSTLTNPTI